MGGEWSRLHLREWTYVRKYRLMHSMSEQTILSNSSAKVARLAGFCIETVVFAIAVERMYTGASVSTIVSEKQGKG